ncbi:MAG: MoxR family ATPase [Roseburia sp.]|nr:MoxR family ATPase [Roseburia sp.]
MEREIIQNEKMAAVIRNVEKIIIGKRSSIELLLVAMLTGGHVLIEDVPGVGKTQLVSSIAHSCSGKFNRLQLTPDVMPSDITGFNMIHPVTRETEFRPGAVFCNFLLADEINRSSPKTQSALLEIMEEGQLSIEGVTYQLPKPFMVLATQNPVETYGTYHLPEAQMDRFLLRISMGYPEKKDEMSILLRDVTAVPENLSPVINGEEIEQLKAQALEVACHERIAEYIVHIAEETRDSEFIRLGASPRASLALYRAAKAYALLSGRSYVLPDDVKFLAPYVLSHRILLSPKGKSVMETPENALDQVLRTVAVPTI